MGVKLRILSLSVLLVACGGKIVDADGGGQSVDAAAGADSQSDSPAPSCKPNESPCTTASECCGGECDADVCASKPSCTTSSNKLCDQCMASTAECCTEILTCNQDVSCAKWLACVQQCEQAGSSALACVKGPCMPQGWQAPNLWYNVQYYCPVCSTD